jgi:thiol:disulfide interchange protein
MKQIRIFLFALLCTVLALPAMAQEGKGIQFFKGTFAQALAKAKAEGKPLFVDFYAVWCGPCKKMEKQIFTQPEVGEYFNKHFIALQLDAEKPENVDVAKTYKVEAFPTLGIFDGEGKALSINVGYMNAQELMAMAKTAVGEVKGFEQLYKEYRQNPNDLTIQQDLLTLAPQFLTTQDGMDAEKWVVRVRKIYQAYIEKKMSDNSLINRKDYIIIGYLGGDDEETTYRLVDYISKNMDAWMAAVGEPAAYYVVEKNDERMLKLVKKGDESYKTYLEKIRTDYKKAYDVIKFTSATPYDKSRDYYNALFAIYKNKDVAQYLKLMRQYLATLGADANAADYAMAAQSLYYAAGNKLSAADHEQAIEWLKVAIPSEKVLMNKINYLVMVGDSYRELKKYNEAEQYYKQAYGESLQMGELEQAQQMIQASVLHKLSTLELLTR